MSDHRSNIALIRDLARAKAAFQQRALVAHMTTPPADQRKENDDE